MKANLAFSLVAFLFILNVKSQSSSTIETITPQAFAEKLKSAKSPQLIDVRTPSEYSSEHIQNALNINWNGDDFVASASKLEKTEPVFVYCKSGGRSIQAVNKLSEMGFTKIYNLDGGMMKWSSAGLSAPSDKIIGICSQEFAELIKSDKKVLINFYADWCAPCIKMKPFMSKLSQEMKGKVTVIRLNADENKTILSDMKLDELPIIILYENGNEVWKHSGFISEEDLKKQL